MIITLFESLHLETCAEYYQKVTDYARVFRYFNISNLKMFTSNFLYPFGVTVILF